MARTAAQGRDYTHLGNVAFQHRQPTQAHTGITTTFAPFFDKDALTDKPARFFVNEIIREKILLTYDKEIPYACEVAVELFKESDKRIEISAVIYVERDSQKGIIIGKGGAALKRVGTLARKDIEAFFDKQVYLQLYVKVEKTGATERTNCAVLDM